MTPVHLVSSYIRNRHRLNSINHTIIHKESISGICITVVVALVLVIVAKICFGNKGPGLETFMICVVLLLVIASCMCCRAIQSQENSTQENLTTANVSDGESVSQSVNQDVNQSVNQDGSQRTLRQSVPRTVRQNSPSSPSMQQNPPPPPYRIAILISSPDASDEEPPPSYVNVTK